MKLTRDQKSKIALGVFGSLALYMVYTNLFSGPDVPPQAAASRVTAPASPSPAYTEQTVAKRAAAVNRGRGDEFHPVWRSKRAEDRIDPMKIDPTLMTDLLAKVEAVEPSGGSRNLFAFSTPPPKVAELPKGPEPRIMGPLKAPDPAPPAPPAAEAPPAPVTFKFYGFSTVRQNGHKSAYFLDGEDILIAAEGETLKRRYKLVRISATSVLLEDTESKRQQSLPLTQEAPSS